MQNIDKQWGTSLTVKSCQFFFLAAVPSKTHTIPLNLANSLRK